MKTLLAALLFLLAPLAQAETYRVDLIVFLDKAAGGEHGRRPDPPALTRALELGNTAALAASGIKILPDEQFALNAEWQKLKSAKRYQPLVRLAFTQKDPPAERSVALHVKWGEGFPVTDADSNTSTLVSPLDGSIALLLGRYLHLDADLAYTTRTAERTLSYPLKERRKMRRDELHFIDGARLGLLTRVTKAS